MSEPARAEGGFTLLEVLIAVFVLGTVLGSLVTLVIGNLARLSDAKSELLEMRLAEQRIRELEDEFQSGKAVTDGIDSGRFEEPNDEIEWQVLIEPYRLPLPSGYEDVGAASPLFETSEPNAEVVLRRVEVRVFAVESSPEDAKPVVILIPEPLLAVEVPEEANS